jgi:hypothetical protein
MFAASDFADVAYQFPQGCCWPGDSARLVRRVIARLQTLFIRDDVPVLLALDEPDNPDGAPSGIIVVAEDRTAVVPLQCRKTLVRVDSEPTYTGDSGAVMRLARAVADALDWYAAQMQAPKTPRRERRA